jgi:unsaturated chondroitin disaccharide hydrolase
MAVSHARQTMRHQFRKDYTSYHVALYDSITGEFLRGCTNQGLNDNSFWARGQAWGIYGFTFVYRETGDKEFLRFAEKITDAYLSRLPKDMIPYWDFDDPKIPHATRDASAAAIVASALIELSGLEDNPKLARKYQKAAEQMLLMLSSENYQSRQKNSAFLLHTTGNLPAGYEIDASINYADYYYIEALTRYRQLVLNKR